MEWIFAVDMNPVNKAAANNIIIDDLIFEFINFIYLLQFDDIWSSYQKTIKQI